MAVPRRQESRRGGADAASEQPSPRISHREDVVGMSQVIQVRAARAVDADVLIEFNCRLAAETEHRQLDRLVVARGVAAALADPGKARYFVACAGDRVVGQLMHTWEWSDWRDGYFWWLQSVYVDATWRRRGVFRALYEHLCAAAEADPQVVGLRLYVERENLAAQEAYRRLGMSGAGYLVLERMTG